MPRPVVIATTALAGRYGASTAENIERGLHLLDLAGAHRPDLACLPEMFPHAGFPMARVAESAEPVSGPLFAALAERARRFEMNVIAGVAELRDNRLYNTAWVIDRRGHLVGRYDKRHPIIKEVNAGIIPGDAPGIVDLDIGRVGIAICFDIGWPDDWDELGAHGAELVVWPSAYDGGFPLQTYAWRNTYPLVTSVWSAGARVIDATGQIVSQTSRYATLLVETIDLDTLVMHVNYNDAKLEQIMAEYGRRITVRTLDAEAVVTLASNDPTLSVATIARDYELESFRDYHARSTRRQAEGRAAVGALVATS